MSARYRYRCGECPFRTPWTSASQAAERRTRHCARHHPDLPPSGRVERRRPPFEGLPTLVLVATLLLLLPVLVLCAHVQP
ncbi:hypothetical protein [Saccharopolyspora flava]|uniref:Uncharacterized protein n=1 Tax=Saccharopolyspora flava TaxID=95161 RepID=A0A1I6RNG5_9PSEU|nr:hypothetical protein [Saccharopolyspora flava]SFS66249.1 hypothetical protein SAMN05660874_02430 [Saccharopolyspora flava]